MQNLEFKAELRDPSLAAAILYKLGAAEVGTFEQTDTYYRMADCRFKKRETPNQPAEFIFYERENDTRARLSTFRIYSEDEAAERFGAKPIPVWLVVKKTRRLFYHLGVRIHLDTVESLGAFIEFEALVSPDRDAAACEQLVATLRAELAPVIGEPIGVSYADLMSLTLETSDEAPESEPNT